MLIYFTRRVDYTSIILVIIKGEIVILSNIAKILGVTIDIELYYK